MVELEHVIVMVGTQDSSRHIVRQQASDWPLIASEDFSLVDCSIAWLVQWVRIGYFDFRETQFGIIRQITLIIISVLLMFARKHRFETIHKQRQDNRPDDDLFSQTFSIQWSTGY